MRGANACFIKRLTQEDGLEEIIDEHCLDTLVILGLAVGLLKGPHKAMVVLGCGLVDAKC
jgi:hypothetical protein